MTRNCHAHGPTHGAVTNRHKTRTTTKQQVCNKSKQPALTSTARWLRKAKQNKPTEITPSTGLQNTNPQNIGSNNKKRVTNHTTTLEMIDVEATGCVCGGGELISPVKSTAVVKKQSLFTSLGGFLTCALHYLRKPSKSNLLTLMNQRKVQFINPWKGTLANSEDADKMPKTVTERDSSFSSTL